MPNTTVPANGEAMPAAKKPSMRDDAAQLQAFKDLEDEICSVLNMAHILSDLLEHTLVEYRNGENIRCPTPGEPMKVYISSQEMDCLSFAWNDVINRASYLKKKYYAAWDGAQL